MHRARRKLSCAGLLVALQLRVWGVVTCSCAAGELHRCAGGIAAASVALVPLLGSHLPLPGWPLQAFTQPAPTCRRFPRASAAVLKGHYSAVTSLSLSPDGWTLLSGGRDSVVVAWNMRDHSKLSTVPVFEALEGEMGRVMGSQWLVNVLHGGPLRRRCKWYGWYGLGFRATACTGHGPCLGGVASVSIRLVAPTLTKPCWHRWSLSCCCLDPPHPTRCCRHRLPAARHALPRPARRRRRHSSSWRQGRQDAGNLLCHRRREGSG